MTFVAGIQRNVWRRAPVQDNTASVPFHAVRTRFLGNIASPVVSVAPLETVNPLWGGELPSERIAR